MKRRDDLSAQELREELHYCPETGAFRWLRAAKGRRMATPPGTKTPAGYLRLCIGHRRYLAHRAAWLYVNGYWPESDVDHINGNRLDNRICNLRLATHSENQQNRKRASRTNKSSGVLGVGWDGSKNRWRAEICVRGKRRTLGRYATIEEASAAYQRAKAELHPFYVPETR